MSVKYSGHRTVIKMADFERFVEIISKKESKRVVNITVRPVVADCEGNVWFTDLMLQEGDMLSGYTPHMKGFLKESANAPVWFNGIVRSKETVILLNLGGTSAGLDYKIYPLQDMAAGSVSLAVGSGAHKAVFKNAVSAGDELVLSASERKCLRNGSATPKYGFFQYSAAWDSKHPITVEDKKSARIYVEFQEMKDGDALI